MGLLSNYRCMPLKAEKGGSPLGERAAKPKRRMTTEGLPDMADRSQAI